MLDDQLLHREVVRVPCGEPPADTDCSRRDQTIRLAHRDTLSGEFGPPRARTPALINAERCPPQRVDQVTRESVLVRSNTAGNLVDVDRADVRHLSAATKVEDALTRRTPTESIDENSRVEQERHQPTRRLSAKRSWCTQAAGSWSHSCPLS
ncbi:MAG: hypothetical protein M3353_09715, partial [Actinomycetota bacterium]|nr:hypothetical protein [Actinomycetota bacterium]